MKTIHHLKMCYIALILKVLIYECCVTHLQVMKSFHFRLGDAESVVNYLFMHLHIIVLSML